MGRRGLAAHLGRRPVRATGWRPIWRCSTGWSTRRRRRWRCSTGSQLRARSAPLGRSSSMVARQVDLLKSRGITGPVHQPWPRGRDERDRACPRWWTPGCCCAMSRPTANATGCCSCSSRGASAHSNQVREFLLTDHGIELVDVYIGAAGCWPAPPAWPRRPPSATRSCGLADEMDRRRRELRRSVNEREAHLAAVQDQLDAERAELGRHRPARAPPDRRGRDGPAGDGGTALGRCCPRDGGPR